MDSDKRNEIGWIILGTNTHNGFRLSAYLEKREIVEANETPFLVHYFAVKMKHGMFFRDKGELHTFQYFDDERSARNAGKRFIESGRAGTKKREVINHAAKNQDWSVEKSHNAPTMPEVKYHEPEF